MELGDLKKPLIVLAVLFGISYYVYTHYTGKDVLAYAQKQPDKSVGPMLEYYAAMGYYTRSEYEPAAKGFEQLLTRCATCHAYAPMALLRLGDSYENLRNWQAARDAYQKYLELFPEGKEKSLVQSKYEQVKFKE